MTHRLLLDAFTSLRNADAAFSALETAAGVVPPQDRALRARARLHALSEMMDAVDADLNEITTELASLTDRAIVLQQELNELCALGDDLLRDAVTVSAWDRDAWPAQK